MLASLTTPQLSLKQLVEHLDRHAILLLLGCVSGIIAVGYGGWELAQAADATARGAAYCVAQNNTDGVAAMSDTPTASAAAEQLTVEVAGAVQQPGVFVLAPTARIADAITAAGGLSTEADSGYVARELKLAQLLQDGSTIYIPFLGESPPQTAAQGGDTATAVGEGTTGLISINTAAASMLEELDGIGEKRAEAIIDGRVYSSIEELVTKDILSEGQFADIKTAISL